MLLLLELAVTVCVGVIAVFTSLSTIQRESDSYSKELQADYKNLEKRYISVFKMLTIEVKEEIERDPTFEEMNAWLQARNDAFKDAVGENIFDGFAMTYKGGYAHSWDYGDYSNYDPDTRPWYQRAKEANGEVVAVAPYVTYLDASYLNSDQYIEMTIAQKYNDEISFDLDLKTGDISALLKDRSMEYTNATAVLFDSSGYILSTSDTKLYAHNVYKKDDVITESLSSQFTRFSNNPGHLSLSDIDGQPYVTYGTRDQDGSTYCLMIPFWSVFLRDFMLLFLFSVLLVFFEAGSYYKGKQFLSELSERDNSILLSLSRHYQDVFIGDADRRENYPVKTDEHFKDLIRSGFSADEAAKRFADAFVREEYRREFLEAMSFDTVLVKLAEMPEYAVTVRLEDGHFIMVRFIRSGNFEETHDFIFTIENVDDVMEQQEQMKAALNEANMATAAKSEFLSRMSHDIQTPMNGIIGMTRIASAEDNPPVTKDCLKKIGISSKYLLGLINDVLDMSKIESGKIQLHAEPYPDSEFYEYLNSVFRPMTQAKKQELVIKGQSDSRYIPVLDKLRVDQIVFNLLSNASKYTPEGGKIEFFREDHVTDGKMQITISVRDNGIGMSEEFQKKLFQPFVQEDRVRTMDTVTNSSGLGLAIVRKLVDLMQGTIDVESCEGKGSTFTVRLVRDFIIAADYHAAKEKDLAAEHVKLEGRRVLVFEDNAINQEIAASIVKNLGAEAEIAENGAVGVEKFEVSPSGYYDIILMDIRMPLMDGFEATRRIRNLPRRDAKKIPIIAMTADAFDDDVRRCLDAGMNEHMAKPLDPGVVYRGLSKWIR